MEIQTLKLFVTEAEVNQLATNAVPDTEAVENLQIRLTPEGVVVQGEYPTFLMKVAFETLWELTVTGPEVRARLASVKVAGLPAGILRGALLKVIRDNVNEEPGVRVLDDAVHVNLEALAAARGLPLRVNLTAVRCSVATLVLEANPL
jgi:hypothetical protein